MEVMSAISEFVLLYRRFFGALVILIFGFVVLVLYANNVSNTDTKYEVTIDEGDSLRTLTSEEIKDGGGVIQQ
jgi:hypothetical protein